MDSGEKKVQRTPRQRFWRSVIIVSSTIIITLFVLIGFFPCAIAEAQNKARLMGHLSNAMQIYIGASAEALDYETTKIGKGGFPADIGVKSGVEYVRYLFRENVFRGMDLKIFCKVGHTPRTLAELKADDLAFRFANVSAKDGAETIFLVSRNVVEGIPTPRKWWQIFTRDEDPFSKGYVVFTLGGDGRFYTKLPVDWSRLGDMPPREPKFLEP